MGSSDETPYNLGSSNYERRKLVELDDQRLTLRSLSPQAEIHHLGSQLVDYALI